MGSFRVRNHDALGSHRNAACASCRHRVQLRIHLRVCLRNSRKILRVCLRRRKILHVCLRKNSTNTNTNTSTSWNSSQENPYYPIHNLTCGCPCFGFQPKHSSWPESPPCFQENNCKRHEGLWSQWKFSMLF